MSGITDRMFWGKKGIIGGIDKDKPAAPALKPTPTNNNNGSLMGTKKKQTTSTTSAY